MADVANHEQAVATNVAALGQEFRAASDAKLRKVTRMIDRMPDRGAADALLAPVRDRLAALRPVRNMNRNRLLFTPFDQVLVRSGRWQPGNPGLPRSLLAPVILLLDRPGGVVLPPAPPFDAADPAELLRCGRPLWEAAAIALAGLTVPDEWYGADWQQLHGCSGAALQELLPVMAMVFRSAYAIRTLPSPRDPALEPVLLSMLTNAARSGPAGWGMMLALLMDVAPADMVARVACTIARGDRLATLLRTGVDHAVTQMLVRLEQIALPPPETADEPSLLLQRLVTMQQVVGLREVENRSSSEQKRVARLEQTLDAGNRAMFQRSLQSQFDRFEQTMAGQSGADDIEAGLAVEADARRLRAFAVGASALEGGRDYQAMIDTTIAGFAGMAPGPTAVARLRLVELLGGSERAMQLAASMGAPHAVATRTPS